MRNAVIVLFVMLLSLGCARVGVEGSKEPIKVDVTMRLDIYQHVSKDIDDIENIVSGAEKKTPSGDKSSLLDYFLGNAYAQEGLSPEVEQAALKRRDRLSELESWLVKGVIGENKLGLVEIRMLENSTPELEELIKAENDDRLVIYKSVAAKNGTSLAEVQKIYAKKLQANAPLGSPIQGQDDKWEVKK